MPAEPDLVPLRTSPEDARKLVGERWQETLRAAYGWMVLARALDARMQALQRQGRVGFYGAATGQEAVNVAAGLLSLPGDWIYPGLREQLVALVRGHALTTYVHHLFADARDPALGRNMPCHPSAREVNYVSMSSVIGTQISHAVGTAFGLRRKGTGSVAFAFFGDGATSSNDFHAGMNLAGVLAVPVLFACTNNQWAISVPVERQTAAKSLASKAAAYGLSGQTVDGTDFFACWEALAGALARLRAGGPAEMLEFRLYRMTAHSSSDDPSRYQPAGWAAEAAAHDPVPRFERWLETHRVVDAAGRQRIVAEATESVRRAVEEAEATTPPSPGSLTADVFAPHPSSPQHR